MRTSTNLSSSPDEVRDEKTISTIIKKIGLPGEAIEHLVKSSNETIKELGIAMHHSSYGNVICQLGPICKLIEVAELKESYDELKEHGHSSLAAFIGSGAAIVAESSAFMGGVSLTTAGILSTPEAPPVGAAAITGGIMLMRESENIGKVVRHHVPIIVDSTLDKFTELYTSSAQFVKKSYQKFNGSTEYSKKKYENIESVMLDLDFKEHARELYKHLDQNQQLVYSAITRDLFNEYFKFNQDKTIKAEGLPAKYNKLDDKMKPNEVKKDIDKIRGKLCESTDKKSSCQIEIALKEQNKKLKVCLTTLTEEANKKNVSPSLHPQPVQIDPVQIDPVKMAHEYCEVLHATSQGVALVSHITGNHRLTRQVTQSAAGVTQMVMGIAQIAKHGWAAGPVGMIFGSMNTLISCFGFDGDDSGTEAITEQLAIISKQVYALHEDMLLQFGKVFTALGIINTNLIQGFRQLHEDQMNIWVNVMKLQKSVSVLQDSINMLGYKIDTLGSDLQGYILEDDRKQLQLVLNEIREKSKRPFNRLKLHPQAMAAFKTFNEELIKKKISDMKVSTADVSKSLTTKLGSAEANAGLLLNYAQNYLDLTVKKPIADPVQWQQTTDLLIEMVQKTNEEKNDAIIGEQDYKDFQYLKVIGENWLSVIEQFKINPGQVSKLAELFQRYKNQITHLINLLEKEIDRSEQETKSLIPKFQGHDELKKQQEFKFDFKRNYYYLTATEDWSSCKGFHNSARFMGYDNFGGEWIKHVEERKQEIANTLDIYKRELDSFHADYKSAKNVVPFFKKSTCRYFSSIFMVHDTESDKMPMLPLPHKDHKYSQETLSEMISVFIPDVFITAAMLGIGHIKHTYKFENNEFIYKINFQSIEEEKPIVVCQYNKSCALPNYLNPAEAIWHAYMGGTYPTSGSYTSLQARSVTSPNGDYYVRHYCALPTLNNHVGMRQTYDLMQEKPVFKALPVTEEVIANRVRRKKTELRQTMNERIIQQLESLDSRNALAAALLEVDASAKILIAFLSILFRDSYKRPVAIWTRDEIIDFVKHYQNQDIYLTHQLETNGSILDFVEKMLLEKLNLQTEIAYTPVKNTLNKLAHFIEKYEKHILKDSELAAREKAELNKEAMIYGATQATLMLQTELLSSGHIEAAVHISKMLSRYGNGLLSISSPDITSSAQIGYERNRIFPSIELIQTNRVDNNKEEKEVKKFGYGS